MVAILMITGLAAGILVSGGTFALLTKVGVITRIIAVTGTKKKISLCQIMIIAGGVWGNLVSIFKLPVFGGIITLILSGIMSGIFAGALSIALAETINALPVMFRKLDIQKGFPIIMLAFAAGKMAGSLWWFLIG